MEANNTYHEIMSKLVSTPSGQAFLNEYSQAVKASVISQIESFIDVMKVGATGVGGIPFAAGGQPALAAPPAPQGAGKALESNIYRDAFMLIMEKIENTRESLSSISKMANEREANGFNTVGDELAAITQDTERATNEIMDAVDAIESVLSAMSKDQGQTEEIQTIKTLCGNIITACAFQDITGQRVQKVVEVIELIEEKLGVDQRDAKGGDHPHQDPRPDEGAIGSDPVSREQQKEMGLLDGPALPSNRISQDDVDALFNQPGDQD